MKLLFSDVFGVKPRTVERYGAFNISLVSDLPLFVDPFLLFNSKKPEYRALHDRMIDYLRFLRDKSANQALGPGLLRAWYLFPEIEQNWLGFSRTGNKGHGLGLKFATALHQGLGRLFKSFGDEKITSGSHLEKLCLIREGVGRDNISDFTNNLILEFLLEYTEAFALKHVAQQNRKRVLVPHVRFNYETETWVGRRFRLPVFNRDYVLLTPRDILTRDDTWINRTDLVDRFVDIPSAIPNVQLRAQVNNYFKKSIPRNAKREDERVAAVKTILHFPQLIDYFIKFKEQHGDEAKHVSADRVAQSEALYLGQFKALANLLSKKSGFYRIAGKTYQEALQRVRFFKNVIEKKGGHRLFYVKGTALEREEDLHILYRMTWYATEVDVTREANDGRGPADFKISTGANDKTLVEFKLAKNSQLKRNLERQAKIYEEASDAQTTIKVIVYFSVAERRKVESILKALKMDKDERVVLVDARKDNKPSGSKA
ncbi:MAG TPA: hypothetical protein VGQ49_05575 [Bryobacteraceae bacterium]|jgi:hypothetical protein|nr:hypothetical protein [Bryobacteraceae bacterium]